MVHILEVFTDIAKQDISVGTILLDISLQHNTETLAGKVGTTLSQRCVVVVDQTGTERWCEHLLHQRLLYVAVADGRRLDMADMSALVEYKVIGGLHSVRPVSYIFLNLKRTRQQIDQESLCMLFPSTLLATFPCTLTQSSETGD